MSTDSEASDGRMEKINVRVPDHRLERLSGYPYDKLHAGNYRAIITWDRDSDLHKVEAVGHRRNVYDRHLPP